MGKEIDTAPHCLFSAPPLVGCNDSNCLTALPISNKLEQTKMINYKTWGWIFIIIGIIGTFSVSSFYPAPLDFLSSNTKTVILIISSFVVVIGSYILSSQGNWENFKKSRSARWSMIGIVVGVPILALIILGIIFLLPQ